MRILLLGGGGFRGAIQVPILEHLYKIHKYDFIYGNSVGAINGIMFAQHQLPALRSIWESISSRRSFMQAAWWWPFNGLYTLKPLRKLLETHVHLDDIQIPFAAGVVSLTTGEYYKIQATQLATDAELQSVIEASASIPGLIKPKKIIIDNEIHWASDGGLRNIIPIPPLGNFTNVDIVTCQPVFGNSLPAYHNTLLSHTKRELEILENETLHGDIAEIKRRCGKSTQINIYCPKKHPRGYLDAHKETIQYRFMLGAHASQHPTIF
jgi:predicted acylesterase/phospholipase RssA